MDIAVRQDKQLAWYRGGSYRYLRVRLAAPVLAEETTRPSLNLALVLDRSGSMQGSKIDYARQALDAVVAGLGELDRAALTLFDHEVVDAAPSRAMDAEGKRELRRAIAGAFARGNTDLFEGWLRGAREAAAGQERAAISRVLLVSDGLANTGLTDSSAIAGHAAELRTRGLSTSTIGVGVDFDEVLLRAMAEMGGGNFHFVEHPTAIPSVVNGEFGELLRPYATDIVVRVSAPAGVAVQGWNEVPSQQTPAGAVFHVGDLAQGMETDVVVNLVLPAGEAAGVAHVEVEVEWRDARTGEKQRRGESVTFRYARGEENDAGPRDSETALRVVEVWAARIRRAALERNRSRLYGEAGALVRRDLVFLERYAAELPGADEYIRDLRGFGEEASQAMAPAAVKSYEAAAYRSTRMRPDYGKPRKEP